MALQIRILGQPDSVDQHLHMPLWPQRQMVGRERVFPVRSAWAQAGQSGLLLSLPQERLLHRRP